MLIRLQASKKKRYSRDAFDKHLHSTTRAKWKTTDHSAAQFLSPPTHTSLSH